MQELFLKLEKLQPIPTNQVAVLEPLADIKAVIFDIYGTLLISASGDIGSTELRGQTALQTFRDCHIDLRCDFDNDACGKLLVAEYEEEIHQAHTDSRQAGIPFPEVDIVNIWKNVIAELTENNVIINCPKDLDFKELALVFEMHNNAVYPMPHFHETLKKLNNREIPLGIISNAQFFTPILLSHFLGTDVSDVPPYFHPQLQVYSYLLGRAKPDVFLFQVMGEHLKKLNLVPYDCLYIGNDMLNDISPAAETGFRTALFAGDTRSLRLRRLHPRCKNTRPDAIITSLNQIPQLIGI
jgi:putative hydrolase of the HAD superfamily